MAFFHATGKMIGGSIDNTPIGSTTPSTGVFTTVDLDTLRINDATATGNQYIVTRNTLSSDVNIELPILTANDTFVFEAFAQTLTNKTIIDATNDVAASRIRHATGDIVVSAATAPLYDQALIADDPPTTATWQHIDLRRNVRVATVAAGTLASDFENGDTVDGVILATGNRILIKDQASGVENGIYIVQATGAPVRAGDYASGLSVASTFVFVQEGSTNSDQGFVCNNNSGSDVVGVNTLVYSQFTGSGGGGGSSKISIPLQTIQVTVVSETWQTIAYMPWDQSRHSGYSGGTVVLYADVPGTRTLDVRYRDVTGATTLGSSLAIGASGIVTFAVSNPGVDSELALQVQRSSGTGSNPSIRGAVLEYNA